MTNKQGPGPAQVDESRGRDQPKQYCLQRDDGYFLSEEGWAPLIDERQLFEFEEATRLAGWYATDCPDEQFVVRGPERDGKYDWYFGVPRREVLGNKYREYVEDLRRAEQDDRVHEEAGLTGPWVTLAMVYSVQQVLDWAKEVGVDLTMTDQMPFHIVLRPVGGGQLPAIYVKPDARVLVQFDPAISVPVRPDTLAFTGILLLLKEWLENKAARDEKGGDHGEA